MTHLLTVEGENIFREEFKKASLEDKEKMLFAANKLRITGLEDIGSIHGETHYCIHCGSMISEGIFCNKCGRVQHYCPITKESCCAADCMWWNGEADCCHITSLTYIGNVLDRIRQEMK